MKPLFCIDVTQNKKNDQKNGSELLDATADSKKLQVYYEKKKEKENSFAKRSLPKRYMIIPIISFILASVCALFLIGVFKKEGGTDWPNVLIELALAVVFFGIFVLSEKRALKKHNEILEASDWDDRIEDEEKAIESINKDLGIPSDATIVDVLTFNYKKKNGKILPRRKKLFSVTPYVNYEIKLYKKDDKIILADFDRTYSFKKDEVKEIKTVNKRILIPWWFKDDLPSQKKYRQYEIKTHKDPHCFELKWYYILEVERDGQIFGIYLPSYEDKPFQKVTGIRVERRKE